MEYYAIVNTADPMTGFISVGEVLTEKQVDALGADKLKELVAAGVLGELPGADAALRAGGTGETKGADAALRARDEDDEEDGEELLELKPEEDLVKDESELAPKRGRGKGK